jgi:hypothetical protein
VSNVVFCPSPFVKYLLLGTLSLPLGACACPTLIPVPPTASSTARAYLLGPLLVEEYDSTTTVTLQTGTAASYRWTDSRGQSGSDTVHAGTPRTIPSGGRYSLMVNLAP